MICYRSNQKGNSRKPRKGEPGRLKSIQEQWTLKCERSFEQLKESLVEAPVLAYADSVKPYEVHVHASKDSIGGVLYQE